MVEKRLFLIYHPGDPVPCWEMRPCRLAPLWRRLLATMTAAWTFWIAPWDRRDHEEWSSLRSPVLAVRVAWGIHGDDMRIAEEGKSCLN